MNRIREIFRDWRKNIFWVIGIGLPLGILGSYIGGKISEDKPNLIFLPPKEFRHSDRIVTDLIIKNAGDYILSSLKAEIELEKSAEVRVSPQELKPYCRLENTKFIIDAPPKFKLSIGQSISIAFISDRSNIIRNKEALAKNVRSRLIIDEEIKAKLELLTFFSPMRSIDWFILGILIIIAILLTIIVYILKQRRSFAPSQHSFS